MESKKKGATKHCCYGTCNSDSRFLQNDSIFFIRFAKPCVQYRHKLIKEGERKHINSCPQCKKCQEWVKKCHRADSRFQNIDDVKKDTYICSLHFHGNEGPTEQYPDPMTEKKLQSLNEVSFKIDEIARKGKKNHRMKQ